MTSEALDQKFLELITKEHSLRQVATTLREFRSQGLSRDEAQSILEKLRHCDRDESSEDRILEVLDIVSGFCSEELSVWK